MFPDRISNRLSRRDFLKLAEAMVLSPLARAADNLLFQEQRDDILQACTVYEALAGEGEEIVLPNSGNLSYAEPSVVYSEGKLIAAAIAKDKSAGGEEIKPIQTWVYDTKTQDVWSEQVFRRDREVEGTDPVMTLLSIGDICLVTIAKRSQSRGWGAEIIFSVLKQGQNNWSHRGIENYELYNSVSNSGLTLAGDIDKPWMAWGNGRVWLAYDANKGFHRVEFSVPQDIVLLSAGEDFQFKSESIFRTTEKEFNFSPVILPARDGTIHLIYRNLRPNERYSNLHKASIRDVVYDPRTGELGQPDILIDNYINDGKLTARHLDRSTLNGLVTPQGGLVFTTFAAGQIFVGYCPPSTSEWKLIKVKTGLKERNPAANSFSGFANPFMAGIRTLAVSGAAG